MSWEVFALKRTIGVLLVVSGLAGLAFEIYEFTFSLYLKHLGLSGTQMGSIFAVAAVATVLLRVYLGHLSDRVGRKGIYSGSLALCGATCVVTPLMVVPLALKVLRSLRDGADCVRQAMHALFLYDASPKRFKSLLCWTRGFEVALQGCGALLAGYLVARVSFVAPMAVAGTAVVVGALVLALGLPREGRNHRTRERLGLKSLLGLDLPPVLKLITARQFVFQIGLTASHCFIMQQWFMLKFGAPAATVGIIMALHRFAFGLPMIVAGLLPLRRLRLAAAVAITIQGLSIAGATLFGNLWVAVFVWILHDMIGAAIWNPINGEWVQRFSQEDRRGRHASQSETISALGAALGPLLAGWCVQQGWIDGPFVMSGVLTVASVIPIAWLPRSADGPAVAASQDGVPSAENGGLCGEPAA